MFVLVNLGGQLGNQMFQYAAAYAKSRATGASIIVYHHSLYRRKESTFNHTESSLLGAFELNLSIGTRVLAFTAGQSNTLANFIWQRFPAAQFSSIDLAESQEVFKPSFHRTGTPLKLTGHFLSSAYFSRYRDEVIRVFQPRPAIKDEVERLIDSFSNGNNEFVAVHIRLGDYLSQRGPHSDDVRGWALTPEYYHRALSRFSPDAKIVLFSDQPELAQTFLPRDPFAVSRTRFPATDMLLMSRFKNLIIANSTYSWWSAWMNNVPGRRVIAPKYWSGYKSRSWYPRDIAEPDWIYV